MGDKVVRKRSRSQRGDNVSFPVPMRFSRRRVTLFSGTMRPADTKTTYQPVFCRSPAFHSPLYNPSFSESLSSRVTLRALVRSFTFSPLCPTFNSDEQMFWVNYFLSSFSSQTLFIRVTVRILN